MDPVIHNAGDLDLMGCMTWFPTYQSGDWIRYGGMLYKPDGCKLAYTVGDYASGGGSVWPGISGITKHYMNCKYISGGGISILCS